MEGQFPETRALFVFVIIAMLAMAPEFAVGLTVTDNFRFNLTWPEQFIELFRGGALYPRWLPRSWGGMGSPVFYFYPPLFFWVTSLVDILSGGWLAPERIVPIASALLLAASGVSMRAWLKLHVGHSRALIGAVAYMLAPYHLYDIYGRGALAEASAYASVPIVMLALTRLRNGRSHSIAMLALAFSVLLFSHLPTALLVTLFLIAPYVAVAAVRSPEPLRFLTMSLIGGLLGTMIAAVFIVPALGLLPYVSPGALSGSFYRPENWFFWHVNAGPMSGRMLLIVPIGIAALLFATAIAVANRADSVRRQTRFWAALTILLVAVIAGLIPPLWRIPGLSLVQFPWRALLLVEFTTVTLLAIAPVPDRSPLFLAGGAVLGFSYLVLALIGGHMIGRTWTGGRANAADIRNGYGDAPEYLPAGTRIEQGNGPDDVHIVLPRLPLASAADRIARLTASGTKDGGIAITVDSPAATTVILRRFYFPHWQLHDLAGRWVPVVPDADSRMTAFRAPAGQTTYHLNVGEAPYEAVGRRLTFIALLILALLAIRDLLNRRRTRRESPQAGP
jgi:hypothetical protein